MLAKQTLSTTFHKHFAIAVIVFITAIAAVQHLHCCQLVKSYEYFIGIFHTLFTNKFPDENKD